MTLRIGCVGYGTGGRHFHTPFIAAAEGCGLAGIVARAEATVAAARADWPGVPVFPSLTAMIEAGACDAVTITTPPQTRRALVLEAIEAGLHVIADKPFAPSEQAALDLDKAAKARGSPLASTRTAASTPTFRRWPRCSARARSERSGGSTAGWISTIPQRSRPAPAAACCVTSAAIWWTR